MKTWTFFIESSIFPSDLKLADVTPTQKEIKDFER